MAEERNGRAAFDYFMQNVSRLLADQNFRDVLNELDDGRKETFALLSNDPAAFLRSRRVEIPHDFRVSVNKTSKDAATHGGGGGHIIICDCVEVCFLRWCAIICYCNIFE
jgi:hypothetical protein